MIKSVVVNKVKFEIFNENHRQSFANLGMCSCIVNAN